MKPHLQLRPLRSLARAAGVALSILGGSASALAADEAGTFDQSAVAAAASDLDKRPTAIFFSINDVLAKLDSRRGRGSGAVRLAAYTPPDIATDVPSSLKAAPAVSKDPFGLFTFRAPEGMLWRKWRRVEADLTSEKTVLDQCRADIRNCPPNAAQFLRLVDAVRSKSGRARIDEANRGVNIAIRYVSDLTQHGEPDRWSTPLATFAAARGDCEDYAIAKYMALVEGGVSRDDLQIVLVRDRTVRQDHAVLAARQDGRWLLLDNRHSILMEDFGVASFVPLFAINHDGVHLFAMPYAKRRPPADEIEAAPAAANDDGGNSPVEWTGTEVTAASPNLNSLPLFL
jgi:predicted transglutaminase-like cysteine proteinase